MSVRMKSLYLASLCVLVLACGLCFAVEETCSRFRFRPVKYTFDAQKFTYRVGIVKHDGIIFNLRIKHPEINGIISVESPHATLITKVDEEFYTFELNDIGKKELQKKRQICKFAVIAVDVIFPANVEPYPQNITLFNGNFSCVARKFPPRKLKVCKRLPNIAGNCRCRDKRIVRTYRNGERGYLLLNVTRLYYHELTIGLSSPVKILKIYGAVSKKSSECNTIFKVSRRGMRKLYKRRYVRIWYYTRVDADVPIPEIQYISYGNRLCKTSCGIKPVCPTPPPTTPATEVTPAIKPTTGSIEPETTPTISGRIEAETTTGKSIVPATDTTIGIVKSPTTEVPDRSIETGEPTTEVVLLNDLYQNNIFKRSSVLLDNPESNDVFEDESGEEFWEDF